MDLIQNCNLIVDCDEILVNISPKWVRGIVEKRDIFEPYLDLTEVDKALLRGEIPFKNLVMNRPEYYLNKWLKRPDVDEMPEEIFEEFMKIHHTKGFYEDLNLTKMGVAIGQLTNHPSVIKTYVVSKIGRGAVETCLDSKTRLIQSIIPNQKLEIIYVPAEEKKSDYIVSIDIKNGFIFDDENRNLLDYLESGVSECNFYIPRLGYNRPPMRLLEMADENKVSVSYY